MGTASIAGTVTGSGTPTVALKGVKVTAVTAAGVEAGSAMTGPRGTYRIAALAAATYTLRFETADPAYVAVTWWKNKPAQQGADVFALADGKAISRMSLTIDRVTTIAGTVKGSASTPVPLAGVLVSAYSSPAGEFASWVATDATGAYALRLPSGGDFTLQFSNSDNPAYLSSTWWRNAATQQNADVLSVATGSTASATDIVLDRVASISGTVTGAGTPAVTLGGTTVTAHTANGQTVGYATADANGRYTITGLPAGAYSLLFDNYSNPAFVRQAWWNNRSTQKLAAVITVAAGQNITGKNDVLPAGTSISGSVMGAGASAGAAKVPLANVYVVAFAGDESAQAAHANTDAAGNYTLTGLIAGTYRLQFINPVAGYVPTTWWKNTPSRADATTITVTSGVRVTGRNLVLPVSAR